MTGVVVMRYFTPACLKASISGGVVVLVMMTLPSSLSGIKRWMT